MNTLIVNCSITTDIGIGVSRLPIRPAAVSTVLKATLCSLPEAEENGVLAGWPTQRIAALSIWKAKLTRPLWRVYFQPFSHS